MRATLGGAFTWGWSRSGGTGDTKYYSLFTNRLTLISTIDRVDNDGAAQQHEQPEDGEHGLGEAEAGTDLGLAGVLYLYFLVSAAADTRVSSHTSLRASASTMVPSLANIAACTAFITWCSPS